MPAELWEEAAELAHELGVNRVREAAGLNYESLRRRVPGNEEPGSGGAATEFVELPGISPPGAPASCACTIEIERPDGARLTIRVEHETAFDLGQVVAAFAGNRT
jgi:hypothetical protein